MNNDNLREIIGKEYKCLDHGFVRLIDVMGDDSAIVQAARVSYGRGTKTVLEDRGLIRYLMRNRHTSPFEMVEFKFHIKLPIFVARQWIRHRTANVNEYSGRYSEMINEFYVPEQDQVRTQSRANKQGRSGESLPDEESAKVVEQMAAVQQFLYDEYTGLIERDIAREIARINLPLSNYTEWYWKIDLHNLFHFLKLRMDHHAQYEIRVYAEKMADMVKQFVPLAYEAFEDFTLNGKSFSRLELLALKHLIVNGELLDEDIEAIGLKGREAKEFKEKLDYLTDL